MWAMTARPAAIAVAGFAALAVAMGIGRFAFTPILPMMQGEGTLDLARGGWLASANYLGYLAGGLTAMRLRAAARGAIRAGLLGVGIATLAMGLTHSLIAWLALRAIAGAASAWVLVFASSWCLEQFDRSEIAARRGWLGATLFAGVGAGIAIAGAACVLLTMLGASADAAWIALGFCSLAVAALLWSRLGGAEPVAAGGGGALAWDAETLKLAACYGAFGFGYIIPATFLAAMARESSPDPAVYGWSWPLFGAAAAVSTYAAVAARGRRSDRSLWAVGHGVMAVGVAVPLFAPGIAGSIACALLVGGTFMVVTMAGMQEARRVGGATARALIATMTSAFAVGQIAGPIAVSLLAGSAGGYAPALALAAAALLVSAFALSPARSRTRIP